MAVDFSKWVPKQDAAEALGYSDRTLERKILKYKLRTAQRDVPGRRSITVLHPADFERLKQMTIPPAPAPVEPQEAEQSKELALRPALPATVRDFAAAFLGTVPFPPRSLFLTIKEAATYAGLPQSYLRRLIQEGHLKAINAGGYRISRRHLERLSD